MSDDTEVDPYEELEAERDQFEKNWHGAEQELEEVKAELQRAYTALNEVNSSWVGTGWKINLERFESWLMRHDATLKAAKRSV
jgi:Skp family chaperone for outer membrane proteins